MNMQRNLRVHRTLTTEMWENQFIPGPTEAIFAEFRQFSFFCSVRD